MAGDHIQLEVLGVAFAGHQQNTQFQGGKHIVANRGHLRDIRAERQRRHRQHPLHQLGQEPGLQPRRHAPRLSWADSGQEQVGGSGRGWEGLRLGKQGQLESIPHQHRKCRKCRNGRVHQLRDQPNRRHPK